MAVLVILFALHRERLPFWRSFPVRQRIPGLPYPAWSCSGPSGTVKVVRCGMGPDNVARTLEQLPVRDMAGVILAGFSGGLAPDLPVGTTLAATEVRTLDGTTYPTTLPLRAARTGPILTADRIISTPDEKSVLHAATNTLAVDLESETVARRCLELHIPFGCLRVISDAAQDRLPGELPEITAGEEVRLWPLVRALWKRPALLGDLLHLERATRLAATSLARGLTDSLNSLRSG